MPGPALEGGGGAPGPVLVQGGGGGGDEVPCQFGGRKFVRGKFDGSKEQGMRHGACKAQGDWGSKQEAPGFGVGNFAAKLKCQIPHTKFTAPPNPAPPLPYVPSGNPPPPSPYCTKYLGISNGVQPPVPCALVPKQSQCCVVRHQSLPLDACAIGASCYCGLCWCVSQALEFPGDSASDAEAEADDAAEAEDVPEKSSPTATKSSTGGSPLPPASDRTQAVWNRCVCNAFASVTGRASAGRFNAHAADHGAVV